METEALTRDELRDKIVQLEAVIKAMPGEQQIQIEPKHYFVNGLYAREIFIPKGVTIVGKIHKTAHFCVLSKGHVSVRTENGIEELHASHVVISQPGMKRVMYAHEDSVWINFHHNPTNEENLEKIEEIYVVDTFDQLEAVEVKQIQGGNK